MTKTDTDAISFLVKPCVQNTPAELYFQKKLIIGYFKNITKQNFQVELLECIEDAESLFDKDADIKIEFVFEKKRYIFCSEILNYQMENRSLTLQIPDTIDTIDHRRFQRYDINPLKSYFKQMTRCVLVMQKI